MLLGLLAGRLLLDLTHHDGDLRERLDDLARAAAAARVEALHDEVLADVGLGHDELVDVEAMVVLGVRHRRHDALAHVLGDALPRELEIGERRVHLLAADQPGDEVQLLRRHPEVLRHGLGLGLRQAALSLGLAHYRLTAFLSPPCPWNVRVGANSPNFMPIMSSVTDTGTCLWPL